MLLLPTTWSLLLLLGVAGLPHKNAEDSDSQDGLEDQTSDSDIHYQTSVRDENHPLLTVMDTKPHSMSLMLKPKDYKPDTMVRLLYERVPAHRQPIMQHLDDPVIEYVPLTRRVQSHDLTELPMGKYIVCGEAMLHGEVYQASCFETRIERLDNNSELGEEERSFSLILLFAGLQSGVKVLIVMSILAVSGLIAYAAGFQVWSRSKWRQGK
jgi:hypothetical protein